MKKAIYYLLDVFTERKYGGNQLAIFPEAKNIPGELQQTIAKELNLSETVYLFPKDEKGQYPMRIFTPESELPTAGHPSVGTAFYLAREIEHKANKPLEIILSQKIGPVKARIEFKKNLPNLVTISLAPPVFGEIFEDRQIFAELISLKEEDLMNTPVQIVSCGIPYVIIPVKHIRSIKNCRMRLDIWDKVKEIVDHAFVYAFAPEGEESSSDLHGRMFAPEAGIPEDPATGSANAPLGAYVVYYKIKKSPIVSEQGYEINRPSKIFIEVKNDKNGLPTSVDIGGKCQFIGKGEIYLD